MGIKGARVYSNALKQGIVRRLVGGERVAAVAEGAGIDPKLLYDWWALDRRMGIAGLNRRRGRRAVWNGGAPPSRKAFAKTTPAWNGCADGAACRAPVTIGISDPIRPSATTPTCAISFKGSRSTTAITAIAGLPTNSGVLGFSSTTSGCAD
jgi:transposase-like protein